MHTGPFVNKKGQTIRGFTFENQFTEVKSKYSNQFISNMAIFYLMSLYKIFSNCLQTKAEQIFN